MSFSGPRIREQELRGDQFATSSTICEPKKTMRPSANGKDVVGPLTSPVCSITIEPDSSDARAHFRKTKINLFHRLSNVVRRRFHILDRSGIENLLECSFASDPATQLVAFVASR